MTTAPLWLFEPSDTQEIRDRLARAIDAECTCGTGAHEDALHDLAFDDVPWLLERVSHLAAEVKTLRATTTGSPIYSPLRDPCAALDGAEHVPGCDLPDLHTGNCSVPLIALDSAE